MEELLDRTATAKRRWLPSPLVGEGAEAKRRRERGATNAELVAPPLPALRATFSHKGRRED
jgi:hypothetical protein